MILAGIDEAGYGPLLGPLVVGCSAFELPGDHLGPIPCLWKRLRKLVTRSRCRSAKRLHVADSKQVYSPSAGLKELERSVLTMAIAAERGGTDLPGFLRHVAPHVLEELPRYPWYADPGEPFPFENDAMGLRLFANALRLEMRCTETACVHLACRIVLERELNRMISNTRNKSSALFSISAIHLDHLLNTFGRQGLMIICDRQGGRGHYGPLLRLMFDTWSLEVVSELDGRSEYRLSRDGHTARIVFVERAEDQCLPVALASMLSKYCREALMRRFNAFWRKHLPDLSPTAGYYTDGERFLRDIHTKRQELGIADEELIRCR